MTTSIATVPVADIERMARAVASSKLFGMTTPEQALSLMLVAQAEGRHPASAAQDYHIIQGRPAKKADAMLRDFLSAGGKVQWLALDDKRAEATFSHPAGGTVTIAWDIDRAKRAALSGRDMWAKYPRQMLRSRVVSEGIRTVFPGATSGMYVPEEVPDMPEPRAAASEVRVIEQAPEPTMPEDDPRHDADVELVATPFAARGATVEANARLIAAAPEMLEALLDLVALLPDPELDVDAVQREYVLAARAVIAKATGEAA